MKSFRRFSGEPGLMHRQWDRVARAATVVAVGAALLAVPVAALIGLGGYHAAQDEAVQQAEEGFRTAAVLKEDAVPLTLPGGSGVAMVGPVIAEASWTTQSGVRVEGRIEVEPYMVAGDAVPIWLDDTGNIVPSPATHREVVIAGVAAAIKALVLLEVAIAGGYWLMGRLLGWARVWS